MQKIFQPFAMAALALAATACGGSADKTAMIDKPDFKSEDGIFSIDALEALGRVTSPQLSPDGKTVLYSVSYESVEENRSNADLYSVSIDGSDARRITSTPKSEGGAVWIDGGQKIAFLYPDADGHSQIWTMNADGSSRKQITHSEKGIDGFLFSPDEKKVVMIQQVKWRKNAQDVYEDLPQASGRIIDDMMYKHWDEWVTEIPHPFIADFDGSSIGEATDIMEGEPYESPMKPFGGVESFAWTPDSKQLVYVSRKKEGMEYALSTNSDLYLYNLADGSTRNLTEGMMGYDTLPVFSPDGSTLAWLSMEHDGYESDKNRIFTLNMATGEKTDLTANWDYTADDIAWAKDGKSIFFRAYKDGVMPIFNINVESHKVSQVADGEVDYAALLPVDANTIVSMNHSMLRPNELCVISGGKTQMLTHVNDDIFAQLNMPTVERRMVPTTDGKEMLVWVVKPQNFDATKQYPAILYCQGGPQQAVSQFWSYRWNLALMAANGYVVIAPNRRGLPGFGTEWNAQISGDYGGQNMRDYLTAVDNLKAEPWVDEHHIGAVGASYGGFSVYWLAGHHEGRFAALIAHAGIFNIEAQYLETEEMWFANWDMGGAYWDKENPIAQATFATSPHKAVDKWDTPILITHGELDYRILSSQGEMAFNAAKLRGVPAKMLIFPDENHWILKPQNAILWQRVFFDWLDQWLKP
jgi:dipeptidyl aminopeptidase/acylaminoacyl peptidase